MENNAQPILYIAIGAHISDPKGTVTIGTTTLKGMVCREKNKIMEIKWVYMLDDSKTKRQWDYWENAHMGSWVSNLLGENIRVHFDKSHLENICPQNRTDNWWNLGTVSMKELQAHVQEKIEEYS